MLLAIEATLKGLWRALLSPRSVFFLYLPNLLLSACIAVPIYALFNARLAGSPDARRLFERYDAVFVSDFLRLNDGAFADMRAALAVAGIAWFLCWLFVEGGALVTLGDPGRRLTMTGFFAACGRNFFAFVRGLVPAAVATAALAYANGEADRLLVWYFDSFRGGGAGAAELAWIHVGKTLLFTALFALLVLTPTAFARIRAAVDDDRRMLRGYFAGLGLCLRRPITVLTFAALQMALFLAVLVLADEFTRRVPLDHDFAPFAGVLGAGSRFRFEIPPVGLHISVWQFTLVLLMVLVVARCAGLITIWRAATSPPQKLDPELVYARSRVVDAPAPREPRKGYPLADEPADRGRGRKLHGVALLAASLAGAGARAEDSVPALPAGPFNNEYVIDAVLDTTANTIAGSVRVKFRNFGTQPVSSLPFHLYPNAWSSTGTRWVRDARAERAITARGETGAGYLRIDDVKALDGTDLAAATTIDETIMRIALPQPLAPQQEIDLTIGFVTKLPLTISRMGHAGRHIDAMQWFPKLCAHLGDRFVDWQFREPSEFCANFGKYEVAITLPIDYVIEATGTTVRDEVDAAAGTKTVRFTASGVHDFAWTADPNFVRQVDRSASGTEIVLLSQPFLAPKDRLILDATKLALDRYAEWIFPYPYERVVIDALPPGLGGGMEYPGLFTISARANESFSWLAARSESPASVTIHEFGHQFWYGMVATNEFEEAWLDEGINTYLTGKLLEELFPAPPTAASPRGLPAITRRHVALPLLQSGGPLSSAIGFSRSVFLRPEFTNARRGEPTRSLFGFGLPEVTLPGETVDRFRGRMATYAPVADLTWLTQHSWESYPQHPRTSYTAMAYSKPTLMLRTLEGLAGFDAVKDLLRAWARRNAFRHPTTADFLALADEKLAPEHASFLRAAVTGRDTVDWAIDSVRLIEELPPRGFRPQGRPGDPMPSEFGTPTAEPTLLSRLAAIARGTPAAPAESTEPAAAPRRFGAEIVVRNHGRLAVPTTLELTYDDGTVETRPLDATVPWNRIEIPPAERKLVRAVVDPLRTISLDLDFTNNARLAIPDKEPSITLAAYGQFWTQTLFAGMAWLF